MVQTQAPQSLTIGRLAAAGGVGAETVRFTSGVGCSTRPRGTTAFAATVSRTCGGSASSSRRRRPASRSNRYKELLDLDASNDRSRVRCLANERLTALDARIAELKQARDALKRLAQECGSGSPGPCPILTSFGV